MTLTAQDRALAESVARANPLEQLEGHQAAGDSLSAQARPLGQERGESEGSAQPAQPSAALRTAHLVALLTACKRWVEEGGAINGYGFYRPENPHNFHPDPESCSDEEVANHRAACEAWDRGDYKAPLGSETIRDAEGQMVMHITRAPWGIGSYNDMQDEAADLLAAIDCVIAANARAAGATA